MPLYLHQQGLDQLVVDHLNIWTRNPDLMQWRDIEDAIDHPKADARIAIVGKYTDVIDSYKSINESLVHAGIANKASVQVDYVDATSLSSENIAEILSPFDGVIVPGGFGNRGTEGKEKMSKIVQATSQIQTKFTVL